MRIHQYTWRKHLSVVALVFFLFLLPIAPIGDGLKTSFVSVTHAQLTPEQCAEFSSPPAGCPGGPPPGNQQPSNPAPPPPATNPQQFADDTVNETPPPGPQNPKDTASQAPDAAAEKFGSIFDITTWLKELGNWVGQMMLTGGSFATYAGGALLEKALDLLVVGFGSTIRDDGFDKALTSSWTTVRDICNLAFIFGFIYIGIRTVIDPDSSQMKRFLSTIIIGALLINFSLYITQAVIDFTNFTAVKIYDAIVPPNSTSPDGELTISRAVANHLGINGLFAKVDPTLLAKFTTDGSIVFYFAATTFLWITGITFAAGGIFLLIRFIELIFIMIFSPILFAAPVFPQTADYAASMWRKLISASFYAPAYLLLVYFSIAIANGLAFRTAATPDGLGQAVTGTGSFEVIVNFLIIIGLMIGALVIADKMSLKGGHLATTAVNGARKKISGGLQSAAWGTAGYFGRGGVRAVNATSKKIGIGSFENAEKYRQQLRGSDKWYARAGGRVFGVTAGAAATAAVGAKFGSKQSVVDVDKEDKGYKKAHYAEKEKKERVNAVTAGAQAAPGSVQAATMQQNVVGASTAQLIELLEEFEKDTKAYTAIVASMGHSQFEKLMDEKEENLSEADKAKIRTARETTVKLRLVEAENKRLEELARKEGRAFTDADKIKTIDESSESGRAIAKASIGDLEVLGAETVEKYAQHLTAAQLEDIKKSKKFVEAQYTIISEARKRALESLVADGQILAEIKARPKTEDVAKLPAKFLENAARVPGALSVDVLEKIISQGTVDRGSQQRIIDLVRTQAGLTPEMTAYMESTRVINSFGTQP